MTTAAICASRELSWRPSFYRGEQFDSDLGLYYLRARYYNPSTGRFMSRDPLDGKSIDPKTLHKYLYASGDPVNASDPTGRELLENWELDNTILPEIRSIRFTGAQVRCLIWAAITVLNAVTNHTNWAWIATYGGFANAIWGCKAAF